MPKKHCIMFPEAQPEQMDYEAFKAAIANCGAENIQVHVRRAGKIAWVTRLKGEGGLSEIDKDTLLRLQDEDIVQKNPRWHGNRGWLIVNHPDNWKHFAT
jgi:hypothetical protein